jgi:hypothetical protein
MSPFLYYRVTNPDKPLPLRGDETDFAGFSGREPIGEGEFSAAAGDRQPDVRVNVRGRSVENESRRFPDGAVVYWRVDEETGEAEGWLATASANG